MASNTESSTAAAAPQGPFASALSHTFATIRRSAANAGENAILTRCWAGIRSTIWAADRTARELEDAKIAISDLQLRLHDISQQAPTTDPPLQHLILPDRSSSPVPPPPVLPSSAPTVTTTASQQALVDQLTAELDAQADAPGAAAIWLKNLASTQAGLNWIRSEVGRRHDPVKTAALLSRFRAVGCTVLSGTNDNGRIRINYKNSNTPAGKGPKGLYSYYLSYVAAHGPAGAERLCHITAASDTPDISHLCHNSLCSNSLHLYVEPGEANRERNCCLRAVKVKIRESGTVIDPCPHKAMLGMGCVLDTVEVTARSRARITSDGEGGFLYN